MKETNSKPRVSRRYRYTENYTVHSSIAPDGSKTERIEYTGAYLVPAHTEDSYMRFKKTARFTAVLIWCAIILLLGTKDFSVYKDGLYVLVPVTAAAIPGIYILLGSMKLPAEDRKMQEDTYLFSIARIKKSSVGLLVLFGITAILTVVFFLYTGTGIKPADILFAALILIPVSFLGLLLRKEKLLSYEEEKL